jgi:hypothetical protein
VSPNRCGYYAQYSTGFDVKVPCEYSSERITIPTHCIVRFKISNCYCPSANRPTTPQREREQGEGEQGEGEQGRRELRVWWCGFLYARLFSGSVVKPIQASVASNIRGSGLKIIRHCRDNILVLPQYRCRVILSIIRVFTGIKFEAHTYPSHPIANSFSYCSMEIIKGSVRNNLSIYY